MTDTTKALLAYMASEFDEYLSCEQAAEIERIVRAQDGQGSQMLGVEGVVRHLLMNEEWSVQSQTQLEKNGRALCFSPKSRFVCYFSETDTRSIASTATLPISLSDLTQLLAKR